MRNLSVVVRTLICCVIPLLASCKNHEPEAKNEGAPKSPVELKAEVDRAEATTADPITFRVTLDTDPSIEVSLPEIGSQIQGFRIVDMGEEGPSIVEGRRHLSKRFVLRADLSGSYILPSITVSYKDSEGNDHSVQTGQIFVSIKGTDVKKGEETDIRDIKPLYTIPRKFPFPLLAALGGSLLILSGIIVILYRYRGRRKNKDVFLSAEEIARKELADLMASGLLEEGRLREFVFALSMLLRRYLERKYSIRAAEHTTEEVLTDLRDCTLMDEERKKAAKAFILEIDPIKYRGMGPSEDEVQTWIGKLEAFIRTPESTVDEGAMEEAA